jgi:hypothetical protein
MDKISFGKLIEDEYQGRTVRVVTSWGKVKYRQIEYYPKDQGGNLAVKVNGTWYACMRRGRDRILYCVDKHNSLEFDGQVFKLCYNGGTCVVPRVVRQAESDGYLFNVADDVHFFYDVDHQKTERLGTYPKNPTTHFVLPINGSDHVFIENGHTHFVVKVHTIPDTFEYNQKTYTVSRHDSSTMVSDGSKTFMCVLENGECYVRRLF